MEVRHLRYFIAVAELRHFSLAAEKLHLAQPPLSQQIRGLENELGVRLIDRSKRPIELTQAGSAFLEEARGIMDSLRQARQVAVQVANGQKGRLAIGAVASATYVAVPEILRFYRSQWPDIRLSLKELSSPEQLKALKSGHIDIGFLRPPIMGKEYNKTIVVTEPFLVAVPHGHRLAQQDRLHLRDLQKDPLILFNSEEAPGFREQIVRLCYQGGYRPRFYQQANQIDTMLSMVAAGLGVSIVPGAVKHVCLEHVKYLSIIDITCSAELYAVWRRGTIAPPLDNMLATLDRVAPLPIKRN